MQPGLMDLRKVLAVHAYMLPGHLAFSLASDLSQGLAFLSRVGVLHRDLKPSNCIVFLAPWTPGGLVLKISDFGSSRLLKIRDCNTVGFCTSWYRAPEASRMLHTDLGPAHRYNFACDVWSFGCILAEFACGRVLFETRQTGDDAELMGMYGTHFDDPSGLSNGNLSTASDVTTMVATAAQYYPLIREVSTKKEADILTHVKNKTRHTIIHNTNRVLLNSVDGIQLSKTGFTNPAGFCVAILIEREINDETHHRIVVVMGARNPIQRTDTVKRIINRV
jgi:serine/threonine protein kinase